MIHGFKGASPGNGTANTNLTVRLIQTRKDAEDNEGWFFQLQNLYMQEIDHLPVAARSLMGMVNDYFNFIFIVELTNLVASATLVRVKTATSCKVLLQDVVVDRNHRRQGVGKALIEHAIELGAKWHCELLEHVDEVDEAAGSSIFYPMAGFHLVGMPHGRRGVNVYHHHYRGKK